MQRNRAQFQEGLSAGPATCCCAAGSPASMKRGRSTPTPYPGADLDRSLR